MDKERKIGLGKGGWDAVEAAQEAAQGGILVMSHVGNWAVAARLFRRRSLKIMLFMGVKTNEQVEAIQKDDMKAEDLAIQGVGENRYSPLDTIAGLHFLRSGGFVSMASDRLWTPEQRKVKALFLGRRVEFSAVPFEFSALTGAPLFVFFSVRTGRWRYRIEVSPPIRIQAGNRKQRAAAVEEAVQLYAHHLESIVMRFPEQWYHFERFLPR